MIVVDDMAIIPPRNRQSIRFQPKPDPTAIPNRIIQKIMVHAAMMAAPPTLAIFFRLKSSPKAKSRKTTPKSAHVWMLAVSITEGV